MGNGTNDADLAGLYRDTRERLTALLQTLGSDALSAWVPACPAWSVRDVAAHLAAITEDVAAGRLTGPPTPQEADAQVARFAGRDITQTIAIWEENAPAFEKVVGARRVWPAVIDVASHEQDIRGAIGYAGARDTSVIWHCATRLLAGLRPPVPLRVIVEDAEFRTGPERGEELRLTTTRFEAFRWRMGRRSREQLAGLDWSGDPAPVLDHLVVFGPSPTPIFE